MLLLRLRVREAVLDVDLQELENLEFLALLCRLSLGNVQFRAHAVVRLLAFLTLWSANFVSESTRERIPLVHVPLVGYTLSHPH